MTSNNSVVKVQNLLNNELRPLKLNPVFSEMFSSKKWSNAHKQLVGFIHTTEFLFAFTGVKNSKILTSQVK